MAAYDSYKDSGVKWLGKVPSHWEVKRAKTILLRHKRNVRKEDEIVTCFRDGQVTLRKNRRIEGFTNAAKEFGYQGVRKGDLVIHEMDAFAGAVGVSDSDGKSTPVYSVCTTRNPKYSEKYYAHIIKVMANLGFIQSLSKGIRERSTAFSYDIFGAQLLPIPPAYEQEAIVAYLDNVTAKIDEAIEAQQKMIDALNERKQIIITRAVTKGLNPDAPLRDSGIDWLGQIPAHWEIVRASFVFPCIGSGSTPSSGNEKYYSLSSGYPWIQTGDLNDNILNTASKYITEKAMKDVRLYVYPKGSIIVAMYGATIGKTSLVNFATTVNQACCVLPPNKKCLSQFALYYFQASKSILLQSANGGGQPNINQQLIRRHKILIPPFNEQSEICEYINRQTKALNKSIINCEQMISLLQERKQIIINEVVTGKKKVI